MKPRVPISTMELSCIDAIVSRALYLFPDRDRLDVFMDITTAHIVHPIRLQDLLDADDLNFVHDIVGIERHLDRQNLVMNDCFSPRYSEPIARRA